MVTPHAAFVEPSELRGRTAELGDVLRRAGIPLAVLPGAECLADDVARLTANELQLVAQGPPGRRWLLMEAPFDGDLAAGPTHWQSSAAWASEC